MAIVRLLIVSLMCLPAYNVFAQDTDIAAGKDSNSQYTDFDKDTELVTNIPTPDTQEVFSEVLEINNSLQNKREKIAKSVKDSKFSAKDGVITAVVPGGLIYAAHKKMKHENEKKKLAQVETKLDDMTDGLEKLRSAAIFEPEVVMLEKKPSHQ